MTRNKNQIAFIICANNGLYYEECVWYINQIEIPEGYDTDIICITEAESMASAYNVGMESSNAKYKVYLHQDVFIYNRNFIEDIIKVFRADAKLGMLGVIGGRELPLNAVVWDAWNCGSTYGCNSNDAFPIRGYQDDKSDYMEVEAIDGMLMITQYDIKWREDLNLGWDFYDLSQSLEFRRKGYKIGIPYQKEPWCMHDCGYSKLNGYDEARKKVLLEYRDFFSEPFELRYNLERIQLEQQIFIRMKQCIENGEYEQAIKMASMVRERQISNTNLQYALNVLEIFEAEKKEKNARGFLTNLFKWEEIKNKYDEIKFILRHVEREQSQDQVDYLKKLIDTGAVSRIAVIIIINHTIVDKRGVVERIFLD